MVFEKQESEAIGLKLLLQMIYLLLSAVMLGTVARA